MPNDQREITIIAIPIRTRAISRSLVTNIHIKQLYEYSSSLLAMLPPPSGAEKTSEWGFNDFSQDKIN
jgi:hypothetical protein